MQRFQNMKYHRSQLLNFMYLGYLFIIYFLWCQYIQVLVYFKFCIVYVFLLTLPRK